MKQSANIRQRNLSALQFMFRCVKEERTCCLIIESERRRKRRRGSPQVRPSDCSYTEGFVLASDLQGEEKKYSPWVLPMGCVVMGKGTEDKLERGFR